MGYKEAREILLKRLSVTKLELDNAISPIGKHCYRRLAEALEVALELLEASERKEVTK